MKNPVFGEVEFNTGWKTTAEISLYGKKYGVTVKVKAYFEKDGITEEQENAFRDFDGNREWHMKTAEKLLDDYAGGHSPKRFVPRTILFERDGGYALLLDDVKDADGGVAVCLSPKEEALPQDAYL